MQTLLKWHLDLECREADAKTWAAALLTLPDETRLHARGQAHRHPGDPVQTLVGEELAAARALNDLARQLVAKAAHEIEEATHAPAHPRM